MDTPVHRPENIHRSLMHVLSGLIVLALIQMLPGLRELRMAAGGAALLAWSLEISRRYSPAMNRFCMWVFARVAHPHETKQVNSSTWYTTALLGLALFTSPMVASVAVAVLGFGDPAAALIGRRWGRHRLASGRSLEGCAAFVVAGFAAAFGTLWLCYPGNPHGPAVALAAAVAGAVAELLTRRLDDNLVIPLAAAGGALLAGAF